MKSHIDRLFQVVENHKSRILSAERHMWKNPETGFREWKTHAYMKNQFEELGYQVIEAGNIPGFYADLDTGSPGPRLAVFAEMDSLIVPSHPECNPNTGAVHACGHHAQCAAMLGIAAALKAPGALYGLCGSIRLIVVPAEEGIEIDYRRGLKEQGIIRYYSGKKEFMFRGILDHVDLAMMVHTSATPGISCGKGTNGCMIKEAAFIGKSAHAGGAPHLGINALYAANLAMQTSNSLRETFQEKDKIRFHPIITNGGSAVNAIPDRVTVESYLRGATMDAIRTENEKINRAFAGAAVAMGCSLQIRDVHGYSPRMYPDQFHQAMKKAALMTVPEAQVNFHNNWGTGCSDLGDVCQVMPAIHPVIGGASGSSHSSGYFIKDAYFACVVSAKFQLAAIVHLLGDHGAEAKEIIAGYTAPYPSIDAFLKDVDQLDYDGNAVCYQEDGSVQIQYKK